MKIGEGQLHEIYLDSSARIDCPPELIPAPGQYLLVHAHGSDSPLAIPIFFSDSAPNGFRSAPLINSSWMPGARLHLRGPLGHGFTLPSSARKIALIAFDDSPARLHGLISPALRQNAEVALVCDSALYDFPEIVEVQPLKALGDISQWADFIAIDTARESIPQLRERLEKLGQVPAAREAQVLVRAPMPCGGLAECGVCAVSSHHYWKMACKEGPVFDWKEIDSLR